MISPCLPTLEVCLIILNFHISGNFKLEGRKCYLIVTRFSPNLRSRVIAQLTIFGIAALLQVFTTNQTLHYVLKHGIGMYTLQSLNTETLFWDEKQLHSWEDAFYKELNNTNSAAAAPFMMFNEVLFSVAWPTNVYHVVSLMYLPDINGAWKDLGNLPVDPSQGSFTYLGSRLYVVDGKLCVVETRQRRRRGYHQEIKTYLHILKALHHEGDKSVAEWGVMNYEVHFPRNNSLGDIFVLEV